MQKKWYVLIVLLVVVTATWAQQYPFPTDEQQCGYYNRPYERYEAEEGWCSTNGTFLAADEDQKTIQSEASHQKAVQLINQNSYVSWVVNKAGDGLTIRFSLPDNSEGTGTKGNVDIYAGSDKVGSVQLNSYWAWQYCSQTYPTNNPKNGPVVRMKFDETHLRLSRPIAGGETLKIVKTDNNDAPYTIDFVELEPVPTKVTYESLSGNKVLFTGGNVGEFIMNNQGKTIYIPEGRWETDRRIYLRDADGTQIIGAGMWYTEIYYNAPSNNISTYSYRGIEADRSNLLVEGIYFNTVNNQRYYDNNDSKQVGKGFMGCWGTNSVIRNCWVEHFECGAWIADYTSRGSNNLLVEHCRFRNNYADGINLSHASNGHTVRYCSFRNNGDDDMASWSTARMCTNVTFAYCTAENNWRASSLGFFGGTGHTAHHIAIFDALESGVRVNADFDGAGFGSTGNIDIHDVTIQHCGCGSGSRGTSGDFWGNYQGAFAVGPTTKYDVKNVHIENVTIYDSRRTALLIKGGNKLISNLLVKNVSMYNANFGIYFDGARGNATYCNLFFRNCSTDIYGLSKSLDWIADCGGTAVEQVPSPQPSLRGFYRDGNIYFRRGTAVYDIFGRRCK